MAPKRRYDWDTIRNEYRTGTYSDSELARRHGCSRTAIQKRVKKEGWKRDLSKAVRQSVKAKLIEEDAKVAREVAGRNARTDKDEIDRAADTRLEVIRLHRKDIAALRALETKLIEDLSGNPKKLYITQYRGEIIEKEVALTASERAMATNNLANVQHKRIQLERQAYNLNDTFDPDDEDLDEIPIVAVEPKERDE